jgi:EAL domain-containing protein (putative c-di-GMP-specific phosphodiesterase class I)
VLSQAFRDLPLFDTPGLGDINMTVNLSPEQLKHSTIVKIIDEITNTHESYRGRIALEVTEDAVVDERYQMTAKLQELRTAGFKILLDDFGTGNASIGRLRRFSFDSIKIDRSLIANLGDNKADLAIVRSILLLADSLDVTVIAESVETRDCLDILASEGCRYAQGYYFGRPMPLDQTIDLISQRRETSTLAQIISPV